MILVLGTDGVDFDEIIAVWQGEAPLGKSASGGEE